MSDKISLCHYCGGSNVDCLTLYPDYEDCHGPGGFPSMRVQCADCGLSGPSASFLEIPNPKKIRDVVFTSSLGFTVPGAEYEPQDKEAEQRKLAIKKWNAMPNRYSK